MPLTCYKAVWSVSWPRNWQGEKVCWLRTLLFPSIEEIVPGRTQGGDVLNKERSVSFAVSTSVLFMAAAEFSLLIWNSLILDFINFMPGSSTVSSDILTETCTVKPNSCPDSNTMSYHYWVNLKFLKVCFVLVFLSEESHCTIVLNEAYLN